MKKIITIFFAMIAATLPMLAIMFIRVSDLEYKTKIFLTCFMTILIILGSIALIVLFYKYFQFIDL
ncbi:hypothetical protein D3494_15275 [Listeria monocytogenes]|nr:hypothetical protein [Listeria monocytogenes]MCQ30262.1 hypothetical protein [Listeria monocytogenes]